MAANTCYCCKDKGKLKAKTKSKEDMDLDEALNELGMLSTVTESRKQYLREKTSSRISRIYRNTDIRQQGKKNNFEVIHFNPQYITKVTIGSNQPSPSIWIPDNFEETNLDFGKNYRKSLENLDTDKRVRRLERYRLGRIRRFRRPYEVPWRLMDPMPNYPSQDSEDGSELQSKSNSSSPVKYTSACSLPRSRSFDNLNFAMLKIATDILEETNFSLCKQEIETVSATMRNLQVTE